MAIATGGSADEMHEHAVRLTQEMSRTLQEVVDRTTLEVNTVRAQLAASASERERLENELNSAHTRQAQLLSGVEDRFESFKAQVAARETEAEKRSELIEKLIEDQSKAAEASAALADKQAQVIEKLRRRRAQYYSLR